LQSVVADISAEDVKGIGFDATCSMVALDKTGSPVTVSLTGTEMKLRAISERYFIIFNLCIICIIIILIIIIIILIIIRIIRIIILNNNNNNIT